MQVFIFLLMILALSLATNVSVYDYHNYGKNNAKPVFRSAAPWKFVFNSNDRLCTTIFYRNYSPSVTKVICTFESGLKLVETSKVALPAVRNATVSVLQLIGPEAIINLNLYTSHGLCASIRIAEGRPVTTVRPEQTQKEYKYTDICFKGKNKPCVIRVNLKDFTCKGPSIVIQKNKDLKPTTPLTTFKNNVLSSSHETSTNSSASNTGTNDQSPHHNVLIYVIPSVMGMCVVMLVIYVIVKKYCIQNSHPVETIELNTYATVNEVVYADLNLMHGDSQPQRPDEESPYAEIIGVLHPP